MKYILIILFITLNTAVAKETIFQPVINKLKERGVDTNFINKIINDPRTQFNERFVRINVTGYLKPPDYSSHYNQRAQSRSKTFLQENIDILNRAENEYGVPKEVITSVLWIETRHGGYLGNNHVVSVYLSTALANHNKYIKMNLENMENSFSGDKSELPELEKKLIARSNRKANWALEQLAALEKLDKISPIPALELEGSWAGAFGMSQFLPNSYLNWAVDGDGDGVINLFEKEDAIFSVANYLKINGWGNTESEKRAAVFHYNNSSAYVDAVLKLAELIGHQMPEDTKLPEQPVKNNIKKPLDTQFE